MNDSISRQAAIDALNDGAELLRRVLDNTDIVGTEREKYEWGLGLIESYIYDMEELPSEQSEIIQCKDCKYSYAMITAKSKDGQERWIRFCDKHKNWYPKDDWFCKDGEGKEE